MRGRDGGALLTSAAFVFGSETAVFSPSWNPQMVASESGSGKRNAPSMSCAMASLTTVRRRVMRQRRCD